MTKCEFIEQLISKCKNLPEAEITRAVQYYSESIDDRMEDGMTEEEAVASLGSIDAAVMSITDNASIFDIVYERTKNAHKKSKMPVLWMIFVICTSPIWIPLTLAFLAIVFCVYICIWSVLVALFACVFSFAAVGAVGIPFGFFFCFSLSPSTGGILIGLSLTAVGIFMILLKPTILLTKGILKLTLVISRSIKKMFISEKEKPENK